MSSPLAIGAVSAVLRNLLDNGMVDAAPTSQPVKVTAVAPDMIKLDDTTTGPSLNLFMYRVSPNTGWSNAQLPSRDSNGTRIASPPLALNLHYLLTAYGAADFQAEILLGYGMHLLHERPVLDRATIHRALDAGGLESTILPPAFQALIASDLADQVEAVTLSMEPIDGEEMSRLWSALQSSYRPSAGYVVSVVLIDGRKPAQTAKPVLERTLAAEPGLLVPLPTLERAVAADNEVAAALGESVVLTGHHLDGSDLVARFSHRLLDTPLEIPIGANDDPRQVVVALPSGTTAEQDWPAGPYQVTLRLTRETKERTSNAVAMVLAPVPQLPPTAVTSHPTSGEVTVTLAVAPHVRAGQDARLTVGGSSVIADPHPATTASLTFAFGKLAAGNHWLRLTVDGVESRLVRRSTEPPSFDPAQSLAVP